MSCPRATFIGLVIYLVFASTINPDALLSLPLPLDQVQQLRLLKETLLLHSSLYHLCPDLLRCRLRLLRALHRPRRPNKLAQLQQLHLSRGSHPLRIPCLLWLHYRSWVQLRVMCGDILYGAVLHFVHRVSLLCSVLALSDDLHAVQRQRLEEQPGDHCHWPESAIDQYKRVSTGLPTGLPARLSSPADQPVLAQ